MRISGFCVRTLFVSLLAFVACDQVHGDISDVGDLIFGNGGKIPRDKLGVQNEFVGTPKGGPAEQGSDIRNTLGIRHIRTSFCFKHCTCMRFASASGVSHSETWRSVMIQPGITVLTLIPSGPRSRAMPRDSPSTAAFAVV